MKGLNMFWVIGLSAAMACATPCAGVAHDVTTVCPLDSIGAVRSHVRIGAEIFLDPSYTRQETEMHFRKMKETGLLSRPASLGRNQKLAHPAEASPGHHSDGQVLAHVG